MKQKINIWLFVAAVILLPVAAYAVFQWYEKNFETLPVYGQDKKEDINSVEKYWDSSFNFINQDYIRVNIETWENKIVVADFFFTSCPVICPTMTKNLKRVQEAYAADGELQFASFSVDPETDRPNKLKTFADRFGINNSNWDLITGNKKDIYILARNGFLIAAAEGDGGPTDFIHSEKLVLIDKQQRIRGYYSGTDEKETDKLINDIKKLKNEN